MARPQRVPSPEELQRVFINPSLSPCQGAASSACHLAGEGPSLSATWQGAASSACHLAGGPSRPCDPLPCVG